MDELSQRAAEERMAALGFAPGAAAQMPGSMEELLGDLLVDDEVPVVDVTVPKEWEQLFVYGLSWLQDEENPPPLMMQMAGKAVVAWARKTVDEDPAKARESVLELVRNTSRILSFTAEEIGV